MNIDDVDIDVSKIKEIKVSQKALTKIFSYTRAVDSEIGGLLLIDDSGEIPFVKDALLFKQTASGSAMELDGEKLGKALENIATRCPSKIEMLKGWWHSHNDFDTFWSGTDDECFESMLGTNPMVYGIVVNKAGSIKVRADMHTKIGDITFNNLRIVPEIGKSNKIYVKEAKKKVIKEAPIAIVSYKDYEKNNQTQTTTPQSENEMDSWWYKRMNRSKEEKSDYQKCNDYGIWGYEYD